MIFRYAFTAIAMALCSPAFAQFAVENLIARVPEGYKVDHRDRAGALLLVEMVPQAESVNEWTEMAATRTFVGARNVQLEVIRGDTRAHGLAGCKEPATFSEIGEGVENGYPFLLWSLGCPKTPDGKSEYSWYKAIKGNDSLYVVIRSFRKDPTTEQEKRLLEYFKGVIVCDPRLPAQSCPKA